MITGYNTDVRHRSEVFHVQTEDKGLANPSIESLVYVGGRILLRRRSGYGRLLADGGGKEAIAALMEQQHRTMIAEIRAGRLDSEVGLAPIPAAEELVPPEVPAGGHSPAREQTPSLDQVILDYLSSEAEQEHLVLVMDSPDELRRGEESLLAFRAQSSIGGRRLKDAKVEVRLISTEAEPMVLAAGSTDAQGTLEVRIHLPATLRSGTAALIVAATSEVGTAEIKQLI
jgi:hypothetical protein